jgi:sulfopyruvate decarboxylase subunit beta
MPWDWPHPWVGACTLPASTQSSGVGWRWFGINEPGGLTTLARYCPGNLLHIIFDNESLLSVGDFPTATATGTDLEAIARGAGIEHTATVRTLDELQAEVEQALSSDQLTCIVAKVDAVGPKSFHMDLPLLRTVFSSGDPFRA